MTVRVELRSAKIPWLGSIADHCWFVIDRDGVKDRWEVWQKRDCGGESWSYLHKNLMSYESGVGNGKSRIDYQWTDADALRLIRQIEKSPGEYPNTNRYWVWPGPNSNTWVQWALNESGLGLMLGPTAIGKDYMGLFGSKSVAGVWQLSFLVFGIKIKFFSRFEIHLFGFTLGISIKPLRILHPLLREKRIF